MKKVKLIKIRELENAEVPNNIQEKEYRIGRMVAPPKIGEPFILHFVSNKNGVPYSGNSIFITSTVMEVINKSTFMTRNSIYKIELLKDRGTKITGYEIEDYTIQNETE